VDHVDAYCIEPNAAQPIPRRTRTSPRAIGQVRLAIAGPYRPRARLYRLPDGRCLWVVRLWEYDRAVAHVVTTATLRAFARANRLVDLEQEIQRLADRARTEVGLRADP
jgi:hypothetical protein